MAHQDEGLDVVSPQDHLKGTPREGAGAVLCYDRLPLLGLHRRVDQRRGVRREHFARVPPRGARLVAVRHLRKARAEVRDTVAYEDPRVPCGVQHFPGPLQRMPFLGDGILPDATGAEIRHQQHRLAFVQVDVSHHEPPAAYPIASVPCLTGPSVAAHVSAVNCSFETIKNLVLPRLWCMHFSLLPHYSNQPVSSNGTDMQCTTYPFQ